ESPRGNLPTRPSTRSGGCRWVHRRPGRPICEVLWTRWTHQAGWMLPQVLPRIEMRRPCEWPAVHPRSRVRRACGLRVRSVDWRVLGDRRLASFVEKLWRGIESVWPDDITCLLVDPHLVEILGIE